MKLRALTMQLLPGYAEEYRKRHDEIWPELEKLILAHGISDYSIHLDERSKDIISSRWLTEKKETLHELADRYNVSAERIRQIEANAIKKLRLSMI